MSGTVKFSKAKASRDDSRRPMKKYYVKSLIFSTPAGQRHLHNSFGVLWKLSRDGFLYIHLWIVWARARFTYGTRLALMIPRRNQHSSLMGFGMDPSV